MSPSIICTHTCTHTNVVAITADWICEIFLDLCYSSVIAPKVTLKLFCFRRRSRLLPASDPLLVPTAGTADMKLKDTYSLEGKL